MSKFAMKKLDNRGGVLVFFALSVPVLVGFVGFSIDMARVQTLDTELQRVADAAALAAARRLDGITSLEVARAAGLAVNMTGSARGKMAKDNSGNQVTISFSDGVSWTETPSQARFAVATSTLRYVTPWFGAILRSADMPSQKIAAAESRRIACNITPLMLCKPQEGPFSAFRGQQFRLVAKGTGAQFFPGAFGYLDPLYSRNVGVKEMRDLIAGTNPTACFDGSNLSPRTGAMSNLDEAWNTRFDLSPGPAFKAIDAPPAPNFVSKWQRRTGSGGGGTCSYVIDEVRGQSLPRDSNLTGPDVTGSAVPGTGAWDSVQRQRYFTRNHAGNNSLAGDFPGTVGTSTRFELYLRELGIRALGDEFSTPDFENADAPKGNARLASGSTARNPNTCYGRFGSVSRRLFHVAIVDCSEKLNGTNPVLESKQYAQFFLTEPVVNGEVYAEFIRIAAPDDGNGVVRQIVQLVR